ncbi:hypothetical protein E4T39_06049 [Aureobasidium subglaciale]|nr:hypothetical protein E4T39_06049 [Aureobasidium subglaciale]
MDAAASAINNFLSGTGQSKETKAEAEVAAPVKAEPQSAPVVDTKTTGQKDTTVETEVAPAVQHETVKHEHETKEQTVIDRERHQDHYHTTIQPLKDQEVEAERHYNETDAVEERQINKDNKGDDIKAKVAAQQSEFKNTTEEAETKETKTTEPTITGESVHHHLHETIQPVIEKERIIPEVTHKVKPVHEVIQEPTKNHGVTKNEAMSVEDFKGNLAGEKTVEVKSATAHTASADTTAVTDKN